MVLILRDPAPDWERGGAKCHAMITGPSEPDPFFGHEGDSEDEDLARAICNGTYDGKVCRMRHTCLMFALKNNETWGVWGGMNTEDRTELRRFTPREEWAWRPPTIREEPVAEVDPPVV